MKDAVMLFVVLNVCHWLADFTPLSTKWMLAAKRHGRPVFPIFVHGLVHGVIMFGALAVTSIWMDITIPVIVVASIIQVITHTLIDTEKGRLAENAPKTADISNRLFWVVLGADQLLHQTIIASMIFILLV